MFDDQTVSVEHHMSREKQTLAYRQQELVAMIYGLQKAHPKYSEGFARGLRVYQNNLLATAARALSVTYPVVDQLLGDEAMRVLTRGLLRESPPSTGDWADWGSDLGELILTTPLAQEHPFLFDVATLEWQLHEASRSLDQALEVGSLSLLADSPIEKLHIQLASSIHVMASDYPVDIIWRAHQDNDLNTHNLADELQAHQGRCYLIIHQQDDRPRLQRMTAAEYLWLADIREGLSLGELLDVHSDFDFPQWLSTALENQWIERLTETH
ncbi:DUF2063 domain-containing protein [Pseudomaricurvus alkylphenolicus]|uniref:HvfC/BufC N-terminal domain-containing protein n=1 Tax=Pseudomaricurvus alkylphenolicus TaxID=1306991 RepID=UPI00142302D9|nr:DNA-binding domain-containing protein [Pseudomaricurvus alkylphenolicus]NIB40761.1 DUF2063 domain-containing protein [Pseudomaricurvus alkylphenolicus]